MLPKSEPRDPLAKQIRENQLDFYLNLYNQGIEIGQEYIDFLIKAGYLKKDEVAPPKVAAPVFDKINDIVVARTSERSDQVDSLVDISESSGTITEKYDIITSDELEARRKLYGHIFEGRSQEIKRQEWLPKDVGNHEKDFIDWINSINALGFKYRKQYQKFNLYVQQAYAWLQDSSDYTDFLEDEEREAWRQKELFRCDENALYFLNKYVWYKEGNAEDKTGQIKYIASPVHEFMAYMDDCGYSMGIAKGRQMAATTTLMALDVRDVVFKVNHFMKFITEEVEKASEIIEDKLKFAFASLPEWMCPNVISERDNVFKMGYKEEKGRKQGVGSKIQLVAPKRTAVAGGAPQKVKIDEAGNIPILGQMINNARPTMLFHDKRTGRLVMKRQLVYWGTGGQMDKGGKSFETELLAVFKDWEKQEYKFGIVPIFFDWTCRPGATQEDYDREKYVAYSKAENDNDPDALQAITEFHQTWPNSLSDVFRTSAKTLISEEYITAALKRISDARVKNKFQLTQSGYFEPVYDFTSPTSEGSDVPYKIIDAIFVPTEDIDRRASVTIFMHPERDWQKRYYQGTDPIDTYTGLSNMASTVWDKWYKTPVAIINWRVPNYPEVFLQCTLLSLYYDNKQIKTGIDELIESNRGTSYYEYRKAKGLDKKLVLNYQLPFTFQNKTTINDGVGIDNKGIRNTMIINQMHDMFTFYGKNFYHSIIFEQAKTFTCKISENGKEMWGPINKKYFMDDVLFGTDFSYICSELVFANVTPENIEKKKNMKETVTVFVRGKDKKITRTQIRRPVKI